VTDDASSRLARQTRLAAVACVAGMALMGVAIWRQRPQLAPLEVSQQTTYITTPTRADGWVDYPEAVDWMRRASLDAGGANAAIPLLRALGQNVLPAGVDRGAILRRLGVTEAAADPSVLKPLREFAATDGTGRPQPPPATMEWIGARCPAGQKEQASYARIGAWLAQSDGPLSNLRTAAQAASLYIPVPRDHGLHGHVGRVDTVRLVDAAEALGCRAALRLLQGDALASWADSDALWRLGMLVARSASVSEYTLGERFWRTAATATVDLAASPGTSVELLSAMQAALGSKLGFAPATETWMFHRLSVLDAAGTPMVAKAGAPSGVPMARVGTGPKLEAINQQFDAVDVAMQAADPKQRIARVDQAVLPAAKLGVVGRSLLGVEVQAVSYQRLASLAVALAKWQREKGSLPAALAELGPLPSDPGRGGSFAYAPSGQQFRLYGVGGDGRDDGGDAGKDVVVTGQASPRLSSP
jgi:hypothetical protein